MTSTAQGFSRTIDLGKVDYNGSGRKNCKVTIEIEVREQEKGLELSICGSIWNPRETDIYSGGQNIAQIATLIPNARVKRIADIWERWHLNGMNAGTRAQQDALKDMPAAVYPQSHYEKACEWLKECGLYEDNGYKYRTAWLYEPLPDEIVEELRSI